MQKRKLMIIDFNQKKRKKKTVPNYYEFYFAGDESLHVSVVESVES